MKIYISLPITGTDISRCRRRAAEVKRQVQAKGHQVITPFDVCPAPDRPYSYYMGRDIQALMQCDAILLLSGWSESRGCNLEWRCAQIYKKQIFQHINHIPLCNQ